MKRGLIHHAFSCAAYELHGNFNAANLVENLPPAGARLREMEEDRVLNYIMGLDLYNNKRFFII